MKKKSLVMLLGLTLFFLNGAILAGEVEEVTSSKDFDAALASGQIVVADFFATWCGPCQMIKPTLEELSKKYAGDVKFVKIDVDKNRGWIDRFGIQGIPDIRLFKNQTQEKQLVGARSKEEYSKAIDSLLG